jgi:hypothetical protein
MRKKEESQTPPSFPAEDSEIRIRRTKGSERKKRERGPTGLEEMLGLPRPSTDVEAQQQGDDERRWLIRHEWEKPDPSTVWRGAGGIAVAIAATAILAALTVTKESAPNISLPWAIATAALVVAGLCLFAHLDVNRGRKAKHSEILVERKEDSSPSA